MAKRGRSKETSNVWKNPSEPLSEPRLGRRLLYAGITAGAVIGGYLFGVEDQDSGGTSPPEPAGDERTVMPSPGAKSWSASQPPPPSLVIVPDAPLFPDANGQNGKHPVRAYEEALPQEIHRPRSIPIPTQALLIPEETAAEPKLVLTVVRPPEPDVELESLPAVEPERQQEQPTLPEPEDTAPSSKSEISSEAEEQAPPPVELAALPPGPEQAVETGRMPAWKQYAAATPAIDGRPMIAVVIDDMGVDRRRSSKIMELDGPLTLSFLTYAQDMESQTLRARLAGHELMLHMPMQPQSAALDPGPNVLRSDLGEEELRARINWGLDRLEGMVGVNNHMGSRFTTDLDSMRVVMDVLKERGLFFLDSRTVGGTKGPEAALTAGVPFLERNVFLDNINDTAAVNTRLAELEKVALTHGFAIGIGHPRDATAEALMYWLADLRRRGFVLVPLSTIIARMVETG